MVSTEHFQNIIGLQGERIYCDYAGCALVVNRTFSVALEIFYSDEIKS